LAPGPVAKRHLEEGAAPSPPAFGATVDWMILVYIFVPLYALVMCSVAWNIWADSRKESESATTPLGSDEPKGWIRTVNRGRSHWNRDVRNRQSGMDVFGIQRQIRFGFLRKVYAILSTQLLVTFGIVLVFIAASFQNFNPMYTTNFYYGIVENYYVVWLAFIPMMVVLCALMCAKNHYPINYILLFLFTIVEGCVLGIICVMYYGAGYGDQVVLASALTVGIFLALTVFTLQSKWDWSWLGPALFAASWILFFWCFVSFWMVPYGAGSAYGGFRAQQLISLAFSLVMVGFIIYDTHMIMKYFGVDDYIIAAIELYLDFINLFVWLLRLLSAGGR